MPPRIPTEADFSDLSKTLPHTLHFPSPREATTSIMILFHGLGDSEGPFHNFARSISLPGVLAISVRGTSPLPPSLLPESAVDGKGHFHWGDDINMNPATGELDDDPGFEKASELVMNRLVKKVLIEACGWEWTDVLLFGFGQGGSLALGIAARLAAGERVTDITGGAERESARRCKGVLSIGGPLPQSMVSTVSGRQKSSTSVLVCQFEPEQVEAAKREFADVRVVNWKRRDVAMPRDREEVLPLMRFFADRLNSGWS
ncbi:hypothetical protein NLU13_1925 [Sarocladium strictum]|uniref:Phospholipase/carboxylesterase/thioesterase domain-containing protein n=1 Tax=Sarocladium strictum TaxID=5046 RepID=A0AA39GRV2_SARSR|nr:hypothetical protein NLU13_1925 [Sarocladium strictum]